MECTVSSIDRRRRTRILKSFAVVVVVVVVRRLGCFFLSNQISLLKSAGRPNSRGASRRHPRI